MMDTTPATDPEIPRRLRAARSLTGLDQTKFAELTGISRSIISQYESGTNTAYKLPFLITWAYFSNVDVGWIRFGPTSAPFQRTDNGDSGLALNRRRRQRRKVPASVPALV